MEHQAQFSRSSLHLAKIEMVGCKRWRPNAGEPGGVGHHLREELKPLSYKTGTLVRLSRYVATRVSETCNEPKANRVSRERAHDGNCRRGIPGRNCRGRAGGDNDI